MKTPLRTVLQLLPLALQFAAMAAAVGIISFIVPVTARLVEEAGDEVAVPAPTQLLLQNSGMAKLALISLFAVSAVTFLLTRSKMKDEGERAIVQSAVMGVIWYVGVTLVGGIVMAALLPHFALSAASQ